MAIKKQTAVQAPPPPPPANLAAFGDMGFYTSGGGIPPGVYALEFGVQNFQAVNAQGVTRGASRLGVMIKAHSLSDPSHIGETAHSQFYSMGSQADKSFAPSPDGKGICPIPGGPAAGLNISTNWAILLKSFYDCGLPSGVFSNNLAVLDGMWVQVIQVPEPEERKSFVSTAASAEVQGEPRRDNKISVATAILDNGKPWEGTGGIPDAADFANGPVVSTTGMSNPAPPPQTSAAQVNRPIAAVSQPAQAPTPANAPDSADVFSAAQSGATDVLGKNLKGCNKLVLRTGTFTAVKNTYGDDMAQAVQDAYFTSDDKLSMLIGALGYKLVGPDVKPQ